ncbi:MAG: hypothetical protein IPG64_06220 [Haliea sp.]|nr:hypothetical protein [Haliea sp.]
MYNATTYNWEGYFIDTAQTMITDNSHWVLMPEATAERMRRFYVNTLEYVASPLANLESEFLDVTPEERRT